MDIKSEFLHSLVSQPRLSPGQKPEDFLGCMFPSHDREGSPLLTLLSFGNIKAAAPWSFDINSLDCYLLLYTKSGCGKLAVNSQVYTLNESSLLFFNCNQRFRLDIAKSPWEYQIIFFGGDPLHYYYSLLPEGRIPLLEIPPYFELILNINLLTARMQQQGICSRLIISDLLNRIVTECTTRLLESDTPSLQIPPHIVEMKNMFDQNFQNPYTLNSLEEHFCISKYRLCREFSKAYGMPPLQYLNRKRIDHAAHLLIATDYRIHEIGSMSGIENANHFISLFKKYLGTTPLEYRRRMI